MASRRAASAEIWRQVCARRSALRFCLAVVVGIAAGYGALGFRLLTAAFRDRALPRQRLRSTG